MTKKKLSWLAKPRNILDDTWTAKGATRVVDALDWLPVWLDWLVFFLGAILIIALCCAEYAIRFLLTPRKLWDMQT